jgi:hypothetical protein
MPFSDTGYAVTRVSWQNAPALRPFDKLRAGWLRTNGSMVLVDRLCAVFPRVVRKNRTHNNKVLRLTSQAKAKTPTA